jgi:phosphoglycerate dehydrogenase-like enzyme
MNVLFHFEGSAQLARRVAALSGEGIDIVLCPENDDAAFARALPGAEVIWHVLKPVTEDVLARAPRMRLVQKIGSGVNTIALATCRSRGIAVCNLPGTNSRAVAEMALLLMLACLRRLCELDRATRNENGWLGAWRLQDRFGELTGRTVGLVGFGAVSRVLAPALVALGARPVYWSRAEKPDAGIAWRPLETLLAESDIVSLHLPLAPDTERLIDARAIARMKPGAILVNTARGALLDEAALASALRSGHLAAAGLDVFATEPPPISHPLLGLPNVVCSPHLAWLTQETLERSFAIALDNVRRLRDGMPLLHRVV